MLQEAGLSTVHSLLQRKLAQYNLGTFYVIGFDSDGVEVMSGRNYGEDAKLKRHTEHLLAIYCVARSLDSPYFF